MKPPVLLLATSLSLPLGLTAPAPAQPNPAAAPRADVAALQSRIAELERENQTLRMQWGQTTMELDRIRKENDQLRRQLSDLSAAPASAAPATITPAASTPPPAQPATTEATSENDSGLRAELNRLRRENEDLRSETRTLAELAALTPTSENVAAQDARISSTFDPAADQTVVRTEPQQVRMLAGSAADHFLSLAYAYPGRELRSADTAQVTGFVQTRHTGGIHRGTSIIEFTLDGETLTVPITQHRLEQRQTQVAGKRRIQKGDETLAFDLDPDALRRLARTVRGEARIGHVRFVLSRDDIAMFKAVQRRIEQGL